MADQNAEKNYGGDQIQVLEGLEAVRKKTFRCILKYIRKRTSSSCV